MWTSLTMESLALTNTFTASTFTITASRVHLHPCFREHNRRDENIEENMRGTIGTSDVI